MEHGVPAASTMQELLTAASVQNSSLLCVGLDPELARLPQPLRGVSDITEAIVAFNTGIIAATADLVCAYKPNLAFYMAHGLAGLAALQETRRLIPRSIPVILDCKVGDLANTSVAYAKGFFDHWDFDMITVNPYMGEDSLAPFLSYANKGVLVIGKTSNKGSGDLQDLPVSTDDKTQPLYLTVADRIAAWAERWPATIGMVVGSTYPQQLAEVRQRLPQQPILLPGIGAQAGDLEGSLRAGLDATNGGLLVSSSRSIIFAGEEAGDAWTESVRAAALDLREAINAVRAVNSSTGA